MPSVQLSSMCRQCQSYLTRPISFTTSISMRTRPFSISSHKFLDEEQKQSIPSQTEAESPQRQSQDRQPAAEKNDAFSIIGSLFESPAASSSREDSSGKSEDNGNKNAGPILASNSSRNRQTRFPSESLEQLASGARAEANTRPGSVVSADEPYHLNVFTHKHNIHITFTEPSRNPILSFSSGNIGLKKGQRGSFDAAYQLTTYTLRKMAEKQWRIGGKDKTMNKMLTLNEAEVRRRGIEVVLRGYGRGREAFQKAIMGTEGRLVKPLVKKVTDSTRIKFGGVRSRAVRRLG